jgi:hypothetical protein
VGGHTALHKWSLLNETYVRRQPHTRSKKSILYKNKNLLLIACGRWHARGEPTTCANARRRPTLRTSPPHPLLCDPPRWRPRRWRARRARLRHGGTTCQCPRAAGASGGSSGAPKGHAQARDVPTRSQSTFPMPRPWWGPKHALGEKKRAPRARAPRGARGVECVNRVRSHAGTLFQHKKREAQPTI